MQSLTPRTKEGDGPAGDGRIPPKNPIQPLLYHDPSLFVVVSKPADVRMDGDFTHTVENLICAQLNVDKERGLRFVQRLDYATSGVLLAALSRPAAHLAAEQFERRTVEKRYRAILHGHPESSYNWTWRVAEEHVGGFRMRAVAENCTEGRAAHTEVGVLRRGTYRGVRVALVEMKPSSGRRHQLRVHAARAGFPIVGDATYIPDESLFFGDCYEPPRMMLHAMSLKIKLPAKGAVFHGKKSAMRAAKDRIFTTCCPFEQIDGAVWEENETF